MHIEFVLFIVVTVISSIISVAFYILNSVLSRRKGRVRNEDKLDYSKDDVTCVITVYNESTDHLINAIHSIMDQVKEIILVEDGDGTKYRNFADKMKINFLSTGGRKGKREAMAIGTSHVSTDIVLFMDGDMIPESGAVSRMIAEYTEKIGGVGGNIFFETDSGNFSAYASQFIERSKELVQRSMKHFGNVMLIDGGFGSYRMDVVGDYIKSEKFRNFKIKGKIPYYGGGDDAELTSYIIRSGLTVTKSFESRVTTVPKESIKAYFKQSVRWSRTGFRNFISNIRNGTMRKANLFYRIEQTVTYALPVIFLAVILLRGTLFFEIMLKRGFEPAFMYVTGLNMFFHGTIHYISGVDLAYKLSTTSSAIASLVFAGTAVRRTVKDRLKTFVYGSMGAIILFAATVYAMFTVNKS